MKISQNETTKTLVAYPDDIGDGLTFYTLRCSKCGWDMFFGISFVSNMTKERAEAICQATACPRCNGLDKIDEASE